MDELDIKPVLNQEFDWDDINVGDLNLDHSENFFAVANKENLNKNVVDNSTVRIVPLDWNKTPQQKAHLVRQNALTAYADEEATVELLQPKQEQNDDAIDDEAAQVRPVQNTNLKLEWSPLTLAQGAGAADPAPKAYAFKDVYRCKRETALLKREEEERKAREFHSRPVPNFKACHQRLQKAVVMHRVTVPRTPGTLKYWQATVERRKQQEHEEQTRLQKEHGKPKARSVNFNDAHFQPKRSPHAPIDIKPFQLHTDQRMRERREYDAAVQDALEQKKRQQEEQRKQRELEEFKEIRKMTEFKARPNPFK